MQQTRPEFHPPQEEHGADAGEATPLTSTRDGITGMPATVADLTCQNGTPAQPVLGNAARNITRRDTHAANMKSTYKQGGDPVK